MKRLCRASIFPLLLTLVLIPALLSCSMESDTTSGSSPDDRRKGNATGTDSDATGDLSRGEQDVVEGMQFSDPYVHKNLSVVFLNYPERETTKKKIMTLSKAEEQGVIEITEKEDAEVEELQVSNHSNDHWIFLQAGDVVEGGKQDRTIAHSTLIPPGTKNETIGSFCVEQSRWHAKAGNNFGGAKFQTNLPQKQAAISGKSQSRLWSEVRRERKTLDVDEGESSAADIKKDKEAAKSYKPYVEHLREKIETREHPVGAVFAINGTVVGAEMYRFPSLFRGKWSQLLNSYARSAVIRQQESSDEAEDPSSEAFISFVRRVKNGKEQRKQLEGNVTLIERDGEQNFTQELSRNGQWIQRTSLRKRSVSEKQRDRQRTEPNSEQLQQSHQEGR